MNAPAWLTYYRSLWRQRLERLARYLQELQDKEKINGHKPGGPNGDDTPTTRQRRAH